MMFMNYAIAIVVAYFTAPFQTARRNENPVRLSGTSAEVRTRYLKIAIHYTATL